MTFSGSLSLTPRRARSRSFFGEGQGSQQRARPGAPVPDRRELNERFGTRPHRARTSCCSTSSRRPGSPTPSWPTRPRTTPSRTSGWSSTGSSCRPSSAAWTTTRRSSSGSSTTRSSGKSSWTSTPRGSTAEQERAVGRNHDRIMGCLCSSDRCSGDPPRRSYYSAKRAARVKRLRATGQAQWSRQRRLDAYEGFVRSISLTRFCPQWAAKRSRWPGVPEGPTRCGFSLSGNVGRRAEGTTCWPRGSD